MSNKLNKLAEIEGVGILELIEEGTMDSVCRGICTNKGCEYTTQVEPDQRHGHCEACGTQTVASALVLAGMI
jgi:hypothetical protein